MSPGASDSHDKEPEAAAKRTADPYGMTTGKAKATASGLWSVEIEKRISFTPTSKLVGDPDSPLRCSR
jgi:hypothetical protein